MTRGETVKLFAVIAATFPRDQAFVRADKTMLDAWSTMLSDVPFAIAQAALYAQASISPFPPSISEIREKAARIQKPELGRTADEAWSYAINAVRSYGYLQWKQAKESMPDDVSAFIERFGYVDICMSENVDVIRGQFMRAWETNAKCRTEQESLPPCVKELIEGMRRELLPE